jgi:ubiquinone/menaquinone biosynthesis C-methylase UbiE
MLKKAQKESVNYKTIQKSDRYKWIYDSIISKLYNGALKVGLTPYGESILRTSVFEVISPYINRGDKILDACCGTGTLTLLLANLLYSDCELIGVDLSPGQIIQAKKKDKYPNLRFEVMDASDLRFKNEYFDKIIVSAALHEMNAVLRGKVLSEIYRVLKKGGYFVIFDHHEPSEIKLRILYNFYLGFLEKILSHSFEMQRKIFKELNKANFGIQKQIPITKFLKFFQIIVSRK